jgi:putative transposase
VPKAGYYVCEVIYEVPDTESKINNGKYLAIDTGVNNLATCVSTETKPFIINGRPLKSINQYYNKRMAELKGKLKKCQNRESSRATRRLTLKRNNKIKDYLHKTSKMIIQKCRDHDINTIVVGHNDGWKQNVNIGKRNNQNFVQIPFDTFIRQVRYKSGRQGTGFVCINESYTSKCSSPDLESIGRHDVYKGKRIKRGLFRSGEGVLINADVNGAFNILRKVAGDEVFLSCRGRVGSPVKICFNKSNY